MLTVSCRRCGAEAGAPCRTATGTERRWPHDQRGTKGNEKPRRSRHTLEFREKQLVGIIERLKKQNKALLSALKQEQAETKRLKRLLDTTDVGTIVLLRAQLADAEKEARRLRLEMLR